MVGSDEFPTINSPFLWGRNRSFSGRSPSHGFEPPSGFRLNQRPLPEAKANHETTNSSVTGAQTRGLGHHIRWLRCAVPLVPLLFRQGQDGTPGPKKPGGGFTEVGVDVYII